MSDIDIFQAVRLNDEASFQSAIDTVNIDVVNDTGSNLLHHAIAFKNNRMAFELMQRGIDVNHQNHEGQTPLHFAAAFSNLDVARGIIEIGGDLSIRDSYGNNPLWTAVFNARGKHDLVKLFVRHGGDSETKNNAGRSPMEFATQIKDAALISLLKNPSSAA